MENYLLRIATLNLKDIIEIVSNLYPNIYIYENYNSNSSNKGILIKNKIRIK
jgi:hypothetical protein